MPQVMKYVKGDETDYFSTEKIICVCTYFVHMEGYLTFYEDSGIMFHSLLT